MKTENTTQIKYTLLGRIPSKKNSMWAMCVKGRAVITTTKDYKGWAKQKLGEILQQDIPQTPIEKAEEVKILFYPPDNRLWDLTNKSEAVMDLLVTAGIIKDDNYKVARRVVLEVGKIRKEAGCEITISYQAL